jgi:hypothetical protein
MKTERLDPRGFFVNGLEPRRAVHIWARSVAFTGFVCNKAV